MTKGASSKYFWVSVVLFAFALFFQSYFVERTDQKTLFICLGLSALAYMVMLRETKYITPKTLMLTAVFLHLIPFFSFPPLSNDYYRFIWDGELCTRGINPYDFKPSELIWRTGYIHNAYFEELYAGMGDLSQQNYSCYPVFNQFYFILASFFTDNLFVNLLLLRLLVVLTVLIGFSYLGKLLVLAGFEANKKWIYIFNPLLLIEVSQNLHFEGVMLTFVILGFYTLAKNNWFMGALNLTFAIQIKLLPLLMLPFILRWLGWRKSLLTWITVSVTTILLTVLLLNSGNYLHFLQSLALYFRQFEFNSFLLHWYLEYGEWQYGYNRIQSYGPYFSRLAAKFILIFALLGDTAKGSSEANFTLAQVCKRIFFALFAYYLLATTVHPWYLLTPLLFGLFTSYRFIQVWAILVFLSYAWYGNISETQFRMLTLLEYLPVLGVFLYEVFKKEKILSFLSNKKRKLMVSNQN